MGQEVEPQKHWPLKFSGKMFTEPYARAKLFAREVLHVALLCSWWQM